jgi:serine/threonine-protein kinase
LQNEEAASTMVKPRLFITKKTLDLVSDGAKRLPGIRHTCPAGVSGPVMEVQEVLWRDPFEFVSERHPVPVGRFMVVKKLKDHGARTVFLARDLKLGVNAIFKSLTSRGARSFDEEQAMQSLRRVGKLAHPSLAIIHDMGKHDGVLYFVREFVEGHSLREEESFAKLQSLPKILTAGLLASRALQYAHREGVLHLNLKPTNCWITQDGKIKLTDFSLLGVHPETFAGRDDGRDDMYIAPEVREAGTASFASDVYSLAAIIFLMISHYQTAVRPHPDRFTPPTPDDGVPESVREVLFSAMAHDPDARPQSMAELERQLRYCQSLLSPQPF